MFRTKLSNKGKQMLIIFETSFEGKPVAPFKFKGDLGEGVMLRYGVAWFSISLIKGHDIKSHHDYVASGKSQWFTTNNKLKE